MLQPGQEIDVWVVEKALGSGGMGSVYRCHNKHAARILAAIKTLEPGARAVPEAEQRFIREAEILFALDHPNVVKVRNIRLDLNTPYLEMEFVEGESLESRLCRGPLEVNESLKYIRQLLEAMVYLHDRGIQHRDIKPANLLINTDAVLKVVDFGLAAESEGSERITRANTTFGTVSYAPPEWVRPDALDPVLWDVYSCGVVFWEMLTARVAFPGAANVDPRQVAIQIMTLKQTHPPLDPGPGFTDEVREICKDMTQSDPALRLASCHDALARLQRIQGVLSSPDLKLPENLPGQQRQSMKSSGTAARRKTTKQGGNSGGRTEPSSGGVIVAVGGFAAILLFVGIVIAGLGLAWIILDTGGDDPATPAVAKDRKVDVVVAGLQRGNEVGIRVGDLHPVKVEGFVYHFEGVPVGGANLRWASGDGCMVRGCPGDNCPQWCEIGETAKVVEAGTGVQSFNLEIVAPAPRDVRLALPFGPDKAPLSATLADGRAAVVKDGALWFEGLAPKKYVAVVNAGTCAADAAGCTDKKSCAPGCASTRLDLIVTPGAGPLDVSVAIEAPAAKVVEKPADKPSEPAPRIDPPPSRPGKGGRPVSQADFKRFIDKNPEWQRDAAMAAGKADNNYLREWKGGDPPAPGSAVVSVSWMAAQAYCAGSGGLSGVDAEPLQWDESATAPFQEWRQKDGKPAWRRSDGADSTAARRTESNSFTGFRCAK